MILMYNTVQYDTDNYSEEILKKNHFVMFYAIWCGHCQRLGPIWEQLAEMLNEDDSNIRIAKVNSKICSEEDVTGYPTQKFFKLGSNVMLERNSSFINEQLRSAARHRKNVISTSEDEDGVIDISDEEHLESTSDEGTTNKPVILKDGKSWRRSLLQLRKHNLYACEDSCTTRKTCGKIQWQSTPFRKSMLSTLRNATLFDLSVSYISIETACGSKDTRETLHQERSIGGDSLQLTQNNSIYEETPCERARNLVLRKCGQEKPLPFEECYSSTTLQQCEKIGEGVYGEVFSYNNLDGFDTVMKIIPIEGNQVVNDEPQKKFHEIYSEIVIAMELSNLRHNKENTTMGFSELKSVKCVQGRYPARLIDLWDLYDETHNSENDSPIMFGSDQLYIILELANGGVDMETFEFRNASESLCLFKQIACSLAVAEQACEFEHRDLHWSNVLISKSDKDKLLHYSINDHGFYVASNGIEVSIIDFTLSRIKVDNSVIYNDIGKDPDLFNTTGEYQFEIYKLMQQKNNNELEHYEPYTNVLWMHYILYKMITAVTYARTTTKVHKNSMRQLIKLKNNILKYNNVAEVVNKEFL